MSEEQVEADEPRPRDTLDDPVVAPVIVSRSVVRGLEIMMSLSIVAALVWLGFSAAPAVARELGITEVNVVSRDFVRSAPAGQAGVDAVRDFEKGIGRSVLRLDSDDDAEVGGNGAAEIGVSSREVVLRETPDRKAREMGVVKKGEAVVVVKREEGWVLVVYQGSEASLAVGWVPERDVLIP